MDALHPNRHGSLLGQYAGFATRLVAFLIDITVLSTTIVAVSWFVNTTIKMMIGGNTFRRIAEIVPHFNQLYTFATNPVVHSLVAVAFILSYYLFFWTIVGQTPGKYFMGVRIITMDGRHLKFRQSVLRYAGYYISALLFGAGFFWILLDDQRRAFHDRLAGTCVVYTWDARPDERFLVQITNQLIHRSRSLKAIVRRHKDLHPSSSIPHAGETGLIDSDRKNS